MKKIAFIMLCGLLFQIINIQGLNPTSASAVYQEYFIGPDGAFSGIAPVNVSRVDENLFRFTGNVTGKIVINKPNAVIDGKGYSLIGDGSRKHGLDLWAENITIKNLKITGHGGSAIDTSKSCNILDNIIVDNHGGLGLANVRDTIVISNNFIERNNLTIWYSGYAKYVIIENNIFKDNINEIYCNYCKNIDFSNNVITGTVEENGIRVFHGENITIRGNTVSNNKLDGVIFQNVPSFQIFGNTFSGNGGDGLRVYSTLISNEVYNNTFASNGRFGLEVLGTDTVLKIYHNRFNNSKNVNTPGSTGIVWDDGYPSGGNYWSNYNGVDDFSGAAQNVSGKDGIGDTPYQISTNNRDRYPLVSQSSGPTRAETELRLEVQVTADKKVQLLGKSFMKPVGQTVWAEFYNAEIDITVKDPSGKTFTSISTKTKFPEFTQPTMSGFNEVVLDLSISLAEGDWTFTASFDGDDDYLPCSESKTYKVRTTTTPETGSLDFHVIDEDDEPVEGVTISVTGPNNYNGVTDSSGDYEISDVPLGSYSYSITKEGYIPVYEVANPSVSNPNIQSVVRLLFSSRDVANVLVTITDDEDNPLGDVVVVIGTVNRRTDSLGVARFESLPLATYTWSVSKTGYQNQNGNILLSTPDTTVTLSIQLPKATKIPTEILCTVSNLASLSGYEKFRISGSIIPSVSNVDVHFKFIIGEVDGSNPATTNFEGKFSQEFEPESKEYRVEVYWNGNDEYLASSKILDFTYSGPGCIVATATYGSELSPEVQFLREFRDNQVQQTFAGLSFMQVFNAFYYSWSPDVARVIASNEVIRTGMRIILYPLIGLLNLSSIVYSIFDFDPELGVLIAGFTASILIGLIYVSPLGYLVLIRSDRAISSKHFRVQALAVSLSLAIIIFSHVIQSSLFMMVSTAFFVVTTIIFSSTGTIFLLNRLIISVKMRFKIV
jgi:parallel beta-helix repeat protein